MLLRYIGGDGRLGLRKGEVYECTIATCSDYIYVQWRRNKTDEFMMYYPYESFKKMFEHWEEV